jgi:hypothetical protein
LRQSHDDNAVRRGIRPGWLLLAFLALLASVGCALWPVAETTAETPAGKHQDLLIGYNLLADILSDESQLGALGLFKRLTLRGPVDEVNEIMKTLDKASKRRASELKTLRQLEPDLSDKPATESPIAEAITAIAKERGTQEVMDRGGAFDIRFVLLQAQATRMVAAIATAISHLDPNRERREWLKSLSAEYEGYRNDVIEIAQKYVAGKGDAQ